MNFYVGQCVKVGGSRGAVMVITSINGDDIVLKDFNDDCTFYYHLGDCSLIPFDYEPLFEIL